MVKLGFQETRLKGYIDYMHLKRNEQGIPVVRAENIPDLHFGLGWVHAYDRLVGMELMRLIARGRAAEHLDPQLINVDIAMRRYNMWKDSLLEAENINAEAGELLDAYCAGVNNRLEKVSLPFEFKLIGYRPDPWTRADGITMLKMMGIVDLTETQGWMEKFIIQMIQQGIAAEQVKELFPYMSEDLNEEYIELIKKIILPDPIVPETVKWAAIPRLQCSNNWAVAGHKSSSGRAILCGDPHLDTSRLPAIWQEVVLVCGESYYTGATVPGIAAPAIGRTNDLAWSATYGFMDVTDYFIEDVKDGQYLKGNERLPFTIREETFKVKKGDSLKVRYYENEHGVLEQEPVEDGYYLCFAWSALRGSGAESLENMASIFHCKSVAEAMPLFAGLDFASFNWALADRDGNIGFQTSGRGPIRAKGISGLLPLPGWDEKYNWQGYFDRSKNPKLYNPPEGYVATANQDLNRYAGATVINLPMAPYRVERISEMLEEKNDHSVDSMQKMHYNLYSKQAELFMKIIEPLLPDSEYGQILRQWDYHYESDSCAPTLFENIYHELAALIFGELNMGTDVFNYIVGETILFHDFYGNFDRIMLSESSSWFKGKSREELLRTAIERGLAGKVELYGKGRKVLMKNLLLGGRLPKFLGFDYGPVEFIGSRATIPQGQIFKSFGRLATFSPTYKFVTDFAEEGIHSTLAGGPSDRRFSRWYTSGIRDWLNGRYRQVRPL